MTRKTILITGCSSGIGLETALLFHKHEWQVVATMRNPEKAPTVLHKKGIDIQQLDVTDKNDREKIIAHMKMVSPHGLDCLVNNAGYGLFGALEDLAESQIRNQMEVNFVAPCLLIQSLLPHLRAAKGKIINISSVFSYASFPMHSLYCASKSALTSLSSSLGYELSSQGLQMCSIEPGSHRTNFGANIEYAEPAPGSSPNISQHEKLLKYRAMLKNKKSSNTPDVVACKIYKAVQSRRMPARIQVGKDAIALYYLKRLLPAKVFTWVIKTASKRIFQTSP